VDIYEQIAKPLGLPRKGGKVAVLAMSYGVGPDKVEASLDLPVGTGKQVLDDFEKQFRQVYQYKKYVVAEARRRSPEPYVTTILGRRRYLPDLRSSEFGKKARAERQAFNTLIQGTAADIMKIALVRLHRMLPPEAKMTLTVHDEVVVICPDEMATQVADIIREAMEGIHLLDVPLIADINIAKKWGDAK
jgi:DNA polymerase-1